VDHKRINYKLTTGNDAPGLVSGWFNPDGCDSGVGAAILRAERWTAGAGKWFNVERALAAL
jgi:hypothetical protein